jgi:thiol-disulfide isomerase/thioredoxin
MKMTRFGGLTMRKFGLIGAVMLVAGSAAFAGAKDPFRKLSYESALKEAAATKKLVFIDFYTTWCGPCKMMDQSTFKDPWVVQWMTEKAISLKVDAERDLKLADKFKVEFYPTLVFLNAKGEVIDTLFGYISPKEFRNAAKDLHKGITALTRSAQALKADPDNPRLRLDHADALIRKNRFAEALTAYLWCLDHGVGEDPTFAKERDTRVIDGLLLLSEGHEPARDEMLRRRDAAEQRLLADKPKPSDAALFAGVSMFAMEQQRVMRVYDAAAARGVRSATAQALFKHAFPALLQAKRYGDIVKAEDPQARVAEVLRDGRAELAKLDGDQTGSGDTERKMVIARTVARAAQWFQVLLGLGRQDAAGEVARQVLAFDSSGDSYHALAWEGYLSGRPSEDCVKYGRTALERAPDEEKANVTDTVARLLDARGKQAEAVSLCEATLAKVTSDRDRWILSTCLSDLRAGAGGRN